MSCGVDKCCTDVKRPDTSRCGGTINRIVFPNIAESEMEYGESVDNPYSGR